MLFNENKSTIMQEEMRFKPRTDIERLIEHINKNTSRKLDTKILDHHMREIRSRTSKRSNQSISKLNLNNKEENQFNENEYYEKEFSLFNECNNEIDDYLNKLKIQKQEENKKLNNKEKYRKLNNRKIELNQEAKNILNEFHHKTHFKAVSTIANHYNDKGKRYFL